MGLKTSQTYRCLERKATVFGFEVADLFAAFSLLALLNFAFGAVPYKILVCWGPPISLALLLRFGKAGKPENHLQHTLRWHLAPGVLSAFPLARGRLTRKRKELSL